MASATPKSKVARSPARKSENNNTKKPTGLQRTPKSQSSKPPAYLQAKLAVSHPQDSAEREADQVATQIARAPKSAATPVASHSETKAQRASLEPVINAEKGDTLALKSVPAAQNVQRRPVPENKNESNHDTALQREAIDAIAGQTTSSETESRIAALRGTGSPMPNAVEADMNTNFDQDFNAVRVHTGKDATDLCTQTNARAFTVGNDIFFAPGEFAPETDAGRELLAHELTHVVQQGDEPDSASRSPATLHRKAKADGGEGTYTRNSGYIEFDSISIPGNYAPAYQSRAPLIRHRAFSADSRTTQQQSTWRDTIATDQSLQKLQTVVAAHPNAASAPPQSYVFKMPSPHQPMTGASPRYTIGSLAECAKETSIPSWGHQGQSVSTSRGSRITSYDVDHLVEAQLGATSESGRQFAMRAELDELENFQLLTERANTDKMNNIKGAVRAKLQIFQDQNSEQYRSKAFSEWNAEALLGQLSVKFLAATPGSNLEPPDNGRWTKSEIEAGTHLDALINAHQIQYLTVDEMGVRPDHIWIFHGPSGGYKNDIDKTAPGSWRNLLSPFEIVSVNLSTDDPAVIMRLSVNVPAGNSKLKRFAQDKIVDVKSLNGSAAVGYFEMERWRQIMELRRPAAAGSGTPSLPSDGLEAKPFSPLTLDNVDVVPGVGLVIEGQILPTLPIIGDADIRYRIAGNELSLSKTFTVSEINLPPPVSLDGCALTLTASTRGFSAEGRIDFSIEHLGRGYLAGAMGTEGGLALEGGFDVDSTLFDRAHIEIWYREGELGAAGDISIDTPDKIRGIRSANVSASYEHNAFTAQGTVQPNIPAVRQGAIQLHYSQTEGLEIAGDLQLAEAPGIRSGQVQVRVRKQGDQWRVSAAGTAQPAIPGIESQLNVSYDDGAFTAEFSGAYARGMLSGTVRVGVTNRSVGADGEPSGEAAPDALLIVYGNGSATIQIAPWLQGTAGIRFAPNGEVTVSGEIGLPSQLEIFSLKEINKPLFALSTQIPIFPGIVAEVGGNLSAHASIGPGALDQLRIGIEYNPSHEENTHVTGNAHLNIPAEAGMRLGARAGIGLGITGASATGGIELGGTLGIDGAAEAGIQIDWMPTTGLRVDAEGYLHAEPKFKFDVSGYVAVTALGFSVYDNTWELAAYELGSNLRLGVRFPIHYQEGQPFNVSLDDVEFEVPDVDPAAMVDELIASIA